MPAHFFRFRNIIGHPGRFSSGPGTVFKYKRVCETDFRHYSTGHVEIGNGFGGKTDNDIRGDGNARNRIANTLNGRAVFPGSIAAIHHF